MNMKIGIIEFGWKIFKSIYIMSCIFWMLLIIGVILLIIL